MTVRSLGQLSLADALAVRGSRSGVTLERIERLVDWSLVAGIIGPVHGSRLGAPGYPASLMIKALLLQQWYTLSDPALEDALCDRISFRRFVGLSLEDRAPDHSTISRFRTRLSTLKLTSAIFEEVTRQIDARGLILRQGTMMDATLVEAQVKRPGAPPPDAPSLPDEAAASEALLAAGPAGEPDDAGPEVRAPSKLVDSLVDVDARWAKKGGKRYFGYKGHVAVDLGSRIIRRARLTAASVQDTELGDALIMGDERAVYADKAYDKKARRAALKAAGIKDRICHRGNKHHKITARQEQRNTAIGRRRGQVEQVFAIAKRLMGWRRVRYIGLDRNAGHFDLLCTAMNINRFAVLTR